MNEIIIKIFKSDTKETKLDEYIRKNYEKEYGIIYYYLNNFIQFKMKIEKYSELMEKITHTNRSVKMVFFLSKNQKVVIPISH